MAEAEPVLMFMKVAAGDPGAAQLWFRREVLDRYKDQAGVRIIRTNTAGRVRTPNWSLDFGIAGSGETHIHAAAKDLGERLPQAERAHWSEYVDGLPMSRNFLMMRIGGGACIDDGELRAWA